MPKNKPAVLPPASDRELALAEQKRELGIRRRQADVEERERLEELADAGEPEAMEKLGVFAMAAAANSQPLEPSPPKRERQPKQKAAAPAASPTQEPEPEHGRIVAREFAPEAKAYELMDIYFRRWARDSKKDAARATRELAIALGGDTVLFMKAGILKLPDAIDQIKKLIDVGRAKSKNADGEDEAGFDEQIAELQKQMRG